MATDNPKISAYVPQIIYDRFKQFKEERNLSFSQAAIEVFAEYFDIDLASNTTRESTGGLPDRVKQLEQIVADLKQSYVYLTEKVELIQSTSGTLNSSTLSVIPDEPLTEELVNDTKSETESKGLDWVSHQLEIVDSTDNQNNNLLSVLPSEPEVKIKHWELAKRLNASEGSIMNKKSKSTPEQFIEWSTKKDPDSIGWQSIKEGKNLYYCPVLNLSNEQKVNLQDWLEKN